MKYFAAYHKDDSIRKQSSSGGVFYALAEYVINQKGVVFGATWNKDWLVDITYAETLEQVKPMMGSKYVLANVGNSFEQCKQFLDQGKLVLYTSIPCQIHGLKNYLKKEYNNLITVDICCHGTIPVQIWKDYLESIQKPSNPIVSINMRDKEYGWINYQFVFKYQDGTEYKYLVKDNKYMQVFLSDKYLRSSCYDCKFKNEFSKADFILGDCWGIQNIYPQFPDLNKGVSVIVVNNKENILNNCNLNLLDITNYAQYLPRFNGGLRNQIHVTPEQYNNLFISKPTAGVISLNLHRNIGGIIQAYALQQTLNSLGYDSCFINEKVSWCPKYLSFVDKHIKLINMPDGRIDTYLKLKDKFDNLIVGSDQVWRDIWKSYATTFLAFTDNWKVNKITYAPSFGVSQWQWGAERTNVIKNSLSTFKAVSVRENDMIDLIKSHTGVDSVITLDPTMLLSKDHYINLCTNISYKNGIFTYILDQTQDKQNFINKVITELNKPLLQINEQSIEEWLAAFRDCDCVITDSYHGCLFSIIFNKPFICFGNAKRGNDRFKTIIDNFNIQDRFNLDINLLKVKPNIDYSYLKEKSVQFLENNLVNKYKPVVRELPDIKVVLCSVAKQENKYIREWVEHYKALGFDNIILYDNNNIDGERFEEVIGDYIDSGFVILKDARGKQEAQIPCFNECYQNDAKKYDWVFFCDVDEFLDLDCGNVKLFVNQDKFKPYNAIAINWQNYDDNNLVTIDNNNYSIKRFTRLCENQEVEFACSAKGVKKFIRTGISIQINSPHGVAVYGERQTGFSDTYLAQLGQQIKSKVKCCDPLGRTCMIDWSNCKWTWEEARLKHYRFKTLEEFITNKMPKGYATAWLKRAGTTFLKVENFFKANTLTRDKLLYLQRHSDILCDSDKAWLNTKLNLYTNTTAVVCSVAKQENHYIREWVEHYKKLGVNKIYLFDNNDPTGERFEDVIGDYITSGYVVLYDVRGLVEAQIQSFNKFYQSSECKKYDWVFFCDTDEFLELERFNNIQSFVDQDKFRNYNAIAVNWKTYDDNGLINIKDNNYSITRFTNEVSTHYNKQTKKLVRTNIPLVQINSAHAFRLSGIERESSSDVDGPENINNIVKYVKCCNVLGEKTVLSILTPAVIHKEAWLNHYRYKTLEEYLTNKMPKGYATWYANRGKDYLTIRRFFEINKLTPMKLDCIKQWAEANNIIVDYRTLTVKSTTSKTKSTQELLLELAKKINAFKTENGKLVLDKEKLQAEINRLKALKAQTKVVEKVVEKPIEVVKVVENKELTEKLKTQNQELTRKLDEINKKLQEAKEKARKEAEIDKSKLTFNKIIDLRK